MNQEDQPVVPPDEVQAQQRDDQDNGHQNRKASMVYKAILLIALPILLSLFWAYSEGRFSTINWDRPFDQKRDSLANIYSDYLSMPECSEKILLRLSYDAFIKNPSKTLSLIDEDIVLPKLSKEEIEEKLQKLNVTLKQEGLESEMTQGCFSEIQTHIKNESWQEIGNELLELLKEIRPLDTHELYRLIAKAEEAANLIKGLDIMLFLGPTGSGKTTTLHFLGGSKMRKVLEEGINHIAPIKIQNPALKNATTSASAVSQTRYIMPVSISFQAVDGSIVNTTICDSPGFGDSSGPEVDIANGIGVIKAVQGCKGVKPVILISHSSSGGRLEGLRDLLQTFAGMLPDIDKHINTFSYLFTKYPEEEKKQIQARLRNLNKSLTDTEKLNKDFVHVLKDIISKTAEKLVILDPVNDEPGPILSMLQQSPSILNPGQVFKPVITKSSETTLKEQLRKHQRSAILSLDHLDYSLAKYKLDELKRLADILGYDFAKKAYNECAADSANKLYHQSWDGIAKFDRCLRDLNTLDLEDVKQYKTLIMNRKAAEVLIKAHLSNYGVRDSASLVQNLIDQTQQMLLDLKSKSVNETITSFILDKLKLLSANFDEVGSSYSTACEIIKEKFNESVFAVQGYVIHDGFNQTTDEMNMIYQSITILKNHKNSINSEETYNELKEFFLASLNNCTAGPDSIFDREELNENLWILDKCLFRIKQANSTLSLRPHFSTTDFNRVNRLLFQKLSQHSEETFDKMPNYFFSKRHREPLRRLRLQLQDPQSKLSKDDYKALKELEEVMFESKNQIDIILFLISRQLSWIE